MEGHPLIRNSIVRLLSLILFVLAFLFSGAALANAQQVSPAAHEGKVYVCKYVGTPGDNERLQTGQNPIDVSINAIKDYQGVGSWFNDAQGRSFVLAEDIGQDEPDVSGCPAPDGGPTPSNTPSETPSNTPSETPSETPTTEPPTTDSSTPTEEPPSTSDSSTPTSEPPTTSDSQTPTNLPSTVTNPPTSASSSATSTATTDSESIAPPLTTSTPVPAAHVTRLSATGVKTSTLVMIALALLVAGILLLASPKLMEVSRKH
jgi:hypothetical protein